MRPLRRPVPTGRGWGEVVSVKRIIVLWLVVQTYCCSPNPRADPYTGMFPTSVPAIGEIRTEVKEMRADFLAASAALEFIASAPEGIREKMRLIELEPVKVGEGCR